MLWKKVRWCVLPHDFVTLVLRGAQDGKEIIPTTDRGDASGSGIYDVQTNNYCTDLVAKIDPTGRYAKSLPNIVDSLTICGELSAQWMQDVGLIKHSEKRTPRFPISAGSGDNMGLTMKQVRLQHHVPAVLVTWRANA